MNQGKVKAVIFIIIGILIVAILCSWLAGKDSRTVKPDPVVNITDNTQTGELAVTPEPGSNAPIAGGSNAFYTNYGNGSSGGNSSGGSSSGGSHNNSGSSTNANNGGSNAYANGNTTTTTTGDSSSGNNSNAQTPENTQTPAAEPTPTPIPEPTPTPEPTPEPPFVPRKLTSATYENSRGMLTLRANVEVETYNNREVLVVVTLSVDSYSMQLYENPQGAGISVNGVFTNAQTPAINIPNNVRTTSEIGTAAFAIELTDGNTLDVPIACEWNFNGTYAGEYIDKIECGGNITISRN